LQLTTRDLEIVRLVEQFSQLSSAHMSELFFADRSHSVPDRVLCRLVRLGYLARVGRRNSGDQGGASAYVYQLGRYGRVLVSVISGSVGGSELNNDMGLYRRLTNRSAGGLERNNSAVLLPAGV
jgi:hypothetical protein